MITRIVLAFEAGRDSFDDPHFKDLDAQPEARSLEHAEWLALLREHEKTLCQQKRFESRARAAKLRHAACVEDVDYRAIRGLDRALNWGSFPMSRSSRCARSVHAFVVSWCLLGDTSLTRRARLDLGAHRLFVGAG